MTRWIVPLMAALLAACSQPQPIDATSFEISAERAPQGNTWRTPVTAHAGQLSMQLWPAAQSSTLITLLDRHSGEERKLMSLRVTDQNCDTGFKLSLHIRQGNADHRYEYFEHIVPWGQAAPINLNWADRTLTVSVSDESYAVTLERLPDVFAAISPHGRALVSDFTFQPQ